MEINGTFSFPEKQQLNPFLEKWVNRIHAPHSMTTLLRRRPYDYRSTSPVEIISCRLDNEETIYLFCKYSGNHTQYSYGHRGGVEYEATIYKNILDKIPLHSARFYGIYRTKSKQTVLAIEYLRGSKLLKDAHSPQNFGKAAAWIGSLHRRYESNPPKGIKVYDNDYYLTWLNSVERMLDQLASEHPWLPSVCRYFRENIHLLSGSAQTLIHGEYYTKNILVKKRIVYPIDWESAAIGPGEIDLASLIEDWDDERKNFALKKYRETRWPDGNYDEEEFDKRMLMVRIYFFLRWTGEYVNAEVWLTRNEWFKQSYLSIEKEGFKSLTV